MAGTTNYTGRSVDLLIMQGVKPVGQQSITTALGGDVGGRVCTGVQKAAQFFLLALLTEKGTALADTNWGSDFLSTVQRGVANAGALRIAFNSAAADILEQQSRFVTATTPDDEVLSGIQLLDLAQGPDRRYTLTVQLTTSAGDTRQIYVPVTLAIR